MMGIKNSDIAEKVFRMVLREAFGDDYVDENECHYGKSAGKGFDMNETRAYLTEAIKSNELRQWFRMHGGVKNVYNEPEYSSLVDKRVFQDGLGDVTDEQIVYLQEFNSFNDADDERRRLMKSDYYGTRSDWDMKALFVIYSANDGMFLLVGLDRNKTDIGLTWGGERTKKSADRIRRNGWSMKTGSNRYVDDSDTYYYSRKGRDFGIYDNVLYKGKMKDNERMRGRMSSSEWNDYQDKRVKDMDDYLRKYYHKGIKK